MLADFVFALFGLIVVGYAARDIKAFVEGKYSLFEQNTDSKRQRWSGWLAFLVGLVGGVLISKLQISWGLDVVLAGAVMLFVTRATLGILTARRAKDGKILSRPLLVQVFAAVALLVLAVLRYRP